LKKALITGITGQDGSYLTELLLGKGYEVHGVVRRASLVQRPRLDHLTIDDEVYGKSLFLHYSDLDDSTSLRRILVKVGPDEFYHLAGQSHVGLSFDIPEATCQFTAMATLQILEILRDLPNPPRFLNIGSSELFGNPAESPQDEHTRFRPITPYGVAKSFAVDMVRVYRESFGLFCCNAICYNHESPRRGDSFVTRKITKAVALTALGHGGRLKLGNLAATRDWGYAPEFVEGMWRVLQADSPMDIVLATGVSTSVERFLEYAYSHVGLVWEDHVEVDAKFVRLADARALVGNPDTAKRVLGWSARVTAPELARIMVDADIVLAGRLVASAANAALGA
jgi:GDPmannose 4,6-dehydratase